MITKEQAEQAFLTYCESMYITKAYDMRNLHFEPVNANIIGSDEFPIRDGEAPWQIELEEKVWLCTFEKRYKGHSDGPLPDGTWPWLDGFCFIVVPKPVPFVMEGK